MHNEAWMMGEDESYDHAERFAPGWNIRLHPHGIGREASAEVAYRSTPTFRRLVGEYLGWPDQTITSGIQEPVVFDIRIGEEPAAFALEAIARVRQRLDPAE